MAINLTHRPDLEIRIEKLADRLKLIGRGRKTTTIERALDALEHKLDSERPSPEYIRESLSKYAANGDKIRKTIYRKHPQLRGRSLSLALQEELYDKHGLPT